ncbi:unnamed protein product [Parajaminaea phylloscopi]
MSLLSARPLAQQATGPSEDHPCRTHAVASSSRCDSSFHSSPDQVHIDYRARGSPRTDQLAASASTPSLASLQCTWPDCGKVFSRVSKLDAHRNAHIGVKPYKCSHDGCQTSFRSSAKLTAHAQTHLPAKDKLLMKNFVCDVLVAGVVCGKRFRSGQHLRRHRDGVHDCRDPSIAAEEAGTRDIKSYPCEEPDCDRVFTKRKHLRSHIWECHTIRQEGSDGQEVNDSAQLFPCTHEGCTKRFPTNSKRRAHLKTHDADRYLCTLPHAPTEGLDDSGILRFATWSALQSHMREVHPPTCLHPDCKGKTFKRPENLRAHMKRHEHSRAAREAQQDEDLSYAEESENEEDNEKNSSDRLGFNFQCNWSGAGAEDDDSHSCDKRFKSAHARDTHVRVYHLKDRPFACSCGKSYGHKHLLKRHQLKCRTVLAASRARDKTDAGVVSDLDSEEEDEVFRSGGGALPDSLRDQTAATRDRKRRRTSIAESQRLLQGSSMVDMLTGRGYSPSDGAGTEMPEMPEASARAHKRHRRERILTCPWPRLSSAGETLTEGAAGPSCECAVRFSRVYDLRRHLLAAHGLCIEDAELRRTLGEDMLRKLPQPRKPPKIAAFPR